MSIINCAKCSQTIEENQESLHITTYMRWEENHVHMECADYETAMDINSRARFNSVQIQKMRQEFDLEKASLRQRTSAMLSALTAFMQKQGATPEEIDELRYEFSFQDESQEQPQDQVQEERS